MTRSIMRRLAGGVAATALAVTTLGIAGAAPAEASSCTTQTTINVNGSTANRTVTYGQSVSIWARTLITGCNDRSDWNNLRPPGNIVIQRSADGRTWSTLATGADSYATYSGPVPRNVQYRAVHNGAAVDGHTFGPSSDRLSVGVRRSVSVRDRDVRGGVRGIFTIRPASSIRGTVVTFQVRRDGAWRRYARVRASSTGVVRATFKSSRRGIKYRLVLPAGRGMVKSVHGPYVARTY